MRKVIFYFIILIEFFIIIYLVVEGLSNYSIKTIEYLVHKEENKSLPLYNRPFRKISDNPNLYVELIPNIETKFDGEIVRYDRVTTIKINSDGFRDMEYSKEKPSNTFRIIVLGDSFTFGFGVESNESWPEVLETKLNSLNNSINYEVLNFGIPGYSTKNEVEMLKLKGMKYDPDMIVIGYVDNDLLEEFKVNELAEKIKQNYSELQNKTRKEIFQNVSLHQQLIEVYTKANEKVMNDIRIKSFSEAWQVIDIPLEKLNNITKNKIKVIIVAFPSPKEHIQALKNTTEKNHWYLIDTSEFLSKYPEDELILHPLDSHPNSFEHKIIGNEVINFLIQNHLIPLSLEELKNFNNYEFILKNKLI